MTLPFAYPPAVHVRRHGPRGYADYAGYRDWVRDEFAFRCVYCLHRERWVPGGFHLDHFLSAAAHPDAATEYDNLLYCCATCNAAKRDLAIPDPTRHLLAGSVSVAPDGTLAVTTPDAARIVEHLGLNRPRYREFRKVWLLVVRTAAADPAVLREVLGYPTDLPDLSPLRPPGGNTMPDGVDQSHFRRRERGELPDTY